MNCNIDLFCSFFEGGGLDTLYLDHIDVNRLTLVIVLTLFKDVANLIHKLTCCYYYDLSRLDLHTTLY